VTTTIRFYVYAAVAIAGALGLVLAPKLVHAVLSLFATLVSVAAIYLLLGSEFLAAMQLFVYGGAITVLMLFVLMLARPVAEPISSVRRSVVVAAGALCVAFFSGLAFTLWRGEFAIGTGGQMTTANLAELLFSRYVVPFEIAGLALTIALIGAIVLAREDDVGDAPETGGEER
jgi:NADH-quinone oxidoreductase subunit J